MQLLDRYVTKRFFTFLLMSVLASMTIFLVVDPIDNLDKFLDKQVPTAEIIRYYVLYIPYIIYLVYPVAVLLATMFCIGGLTSSNELVAMTASGVPLWRHLFTLSTIGLLLSLMMFWWGETIVPETNRERLAIWRQQVRNREDWRLTDQGQVYLQPGPGRVLHLDVYRPTEETGYGVDLYTLEGDHIARRTSAATMTHDSLGWVLHRVINRTFSQHDREKVSRVDSMRVQLFIEPIDMLELKVEPEEMSMEELKRFADRIERNGGKSDRWRVDIMGKIANPFAGFIIILFGVPVSAVRRRSGVIFGVTLSLLITFVYFGLTQVGKVLGYKDVLGPFLAAWLGNIVFLVIGIVLYRRAPR
ncbi:MAG: LPS export ABC transporter permease LptG [bacterium]